MFLAFLGLLCLAQKLPHLGQIDQIDHDLDQIDLDRDQIDNDRDQMDPYLQF